jgi:hypothetical protein
VSISDLLLLAEALSEVGFGLVSLNPNVDDYAVGGLVPPAYCNFFPFTSLFYRRSTSSDFVGLMVSCISILGPELVDARAAPPEGGLHGQLLDERRE